MANRPPKRTAPKVSVPGPRPRDVSSPGTIACKGCNRQFVLRRFDDALRVCPACHLHARVPAPLRIEQLLDTGSEIPILVPVIQEDPLHFDDGTPYRERIAGVEAKTRMREAFAVSKGEIGGTAVVVAAMEFGFFGGSLSQAAGALFLAACDAACAEDRAFVCVCTSGGARMQEGLVSLMQMARCTTGVAALNAAHLPYITILTDPCYGGVTASFAVQADVILAEPAARIGFAGGRVLEQASKEKLPDGFQTSEFLLEHGMIDAIVARPDLRTRLTTLLSAFTPRTA